MTERPFGPPGPTDRAFFWRIARQILAGALVLAVLAAAALGAVLVALKPDTPNLAEIWERRSEPSITLFDREGALLMTRGEREAGFIPLSEMPPYLPQAFLAIEDRRFYKHGGIDLKGIVRALIENVRAGSMVQGGSTITQQLAKNLFLSPERSLVRKIQEAYIANWLETRLSKDAILTLYLNRVYLGAGTYGVEAAARYYFNKSARDVTLAEAAMLAGLPKAPTRFAPTKDLKVSQARADVVLASLVDAGFIAPIDAEAARQAPAQLSEQEQKDTANYFVDWILDELWSIPGEDEVEAWRGKNLVVKTTYDKALQIKAELAVSTTLDDAAAQRGVTQAALVTLDPATGAVLAVVGGKSYAKSQFNRATQALRQPGSAFKPFIYLAALERGMEPDSVVDDAPITVDGWSPENSNKTFAGPVTLTYALEHSLNTVAVRLSEIVGRTNVVETAQRLGIHSPLNPNPSIALGTSEVTLLELTSAYLPFVDGGFARPPFGITEVSTDQGTILYRHPPPPAERIVAERIAATMTGMLGNVVEEGTGKAAQLAGGRPAAGKTGTSQEFRDAWFVGFTPQLLTGVWVGNDDALPMDRVTGGSISASLWRDFMDRAHYGSPVLALQTLQTMPAQGPVVVASDGTAPSAERGCRRWMFWKRCDTPDQP